MKKILSFVLALAMTATLLSSTALADDLRVGTDSPDTAVTHKVQIKLDPNGIIHKYCIDIDFIDTFVFTYDEAVGTWDPEDYVYTGGGTAGWTGNGDIKITNHSDMAVKYAITADVVNTYGDLTITIDNSNGIIDRCTPSTTVGSKNVTAAIDVSGTPNANLTSTAVELGEVKVVISKP